MITIRSSSLSNFESCQRRGVALWLVANELGDEFGLDRPRLHIGAVVGTACHEAAAWIAGEIQRTGEHGGHRRLKEAQGLASMSVDASSSGEIMFDALSPTKSSAIETAGKITGRIYDNIDPSDEPLLIEAGYRVTIKSKQSPDVTLTGTVDKYLLSKCLVDIKTGKTPPKPLAQIGAYKIELEANGFAVERARVDFFRRSRTPPPAAELTIDLNVARQHALSIVKMAASAIDNVLTRGDPNGVAANPSCYMCNRDFCPAYGTDFCRLGEAMKGMS